MLDYEHIISALQKITQINGQATLVTPFLTEIQLECTRCMIEAVTTRFGRIEAVCNDWGLLQWLTESRAAEPVVGRLLVGQATDPRLAVLNSSERQRLHERFVCHADGTDAELRYRRPTNALLKHLRSCSIAIPEVLSFLQDLGVNRFEVSNTLQGIDLTSVPGWDVTLHLPEVFIAAARVRFGGDSREWIHHSFPVHLYQRDNILFYNNSEVPVDPEGLGVNRLVYRGSCIR